MEVMLLQKASNKASRVSLLVLKIAACTQSFLRKIQLYVFWCLYCWLWHYGWVNPLDFWLDARSFSAFSSRLLLVKSLPRCPYLGMENSQPINNGLLRSIWEKTWIQRSEPGTHTFVEGTFANLGEKAKRVSLLPTASQGWRVKKLKNGVSPVLW